MKLSIHAKIDAPSACQVPSAKSQMPSAHQASKSYHIAAAKAGERAHHFPQDDAIVPRDGDNEFTQPKHSSFCRELGYFNTVALKAVVMTCMYLRSMLFDRLSGVE